MLTLVLALAAALVVDASVAVHGGGQWAAKRLLGGAASDDFPVLSTAFTAVLEVTRGDETSLLTEAYDYDADMVHTWHRHADKTVTLLVDEDVGRYWKTTRATGSSEAATCESGAVEDAEGGSVHWWVDSDVDHVLSPRELWGLGGIEDVNRTAGVHEVRGVDADLWEASHVSKRSAGQGLYVQNHVRLFFASQSWTMPHGAHVRVPLRVHMRQTTRNATTGDAVLDDAGHAQVRVFNFDVVDFTPGVPAPSLFQVPAACTSDPGVKPLPRVPDDFSAHVEAVFSTQQRTMELREFYDATHNRARYEGHYSRNSSYVAIMDYNAGRSYTILSGATCTEAELDGDDRTAVGGQLRSMRELFQLTGEHAYMYLGTADVRGIAAEQWRTSVAPNASAPFSIGYHLTWSFSPLGYHFGRHSGAGTAATYRHPLRARVIGNEFANGVAVKPFDHTYDFLDFIAGPPAASRFAIPAICPSAPAAAVDGGGLDPRLQDHMSTGSAVAMTLFVTLFLGLLVVAAAYYYISHRYAKKEA